MSVLPSRPYFVACRWEDRHDPSRYEVEPIDTRVPSLDEALADAKELYRLAYGGLAGPRFDPYAEFHQGFDPYEELCREQGDREEVCRRAALLHEKLTSVALGLSTTAEMSTLLDIVREVDRILVHNDECALILDGEISGYGWEEVS